MTWRACARLSMSTQQLVSEHETLKSISICVCFSSRLIHILSICISVESNGQLKFHARMILMSSHKNRNINFLPKMKYTCLAIHARVSKAIIISFSAVNQLNCNSFVSKISTTQTQVRSVETAASAESISNNNNLNNVNWPTSCGNANNWDISEYFSTSRVVYLTFTFGSNRMWIGWFSNWIWTNLKKPTSNIDSSVWERWIWN